MKVPQNKKEALEYMKCLETDFEMLDSGEWNPDDDSIAASLEVVRAVIAFLVKK